MKLAGDYTFEALQHEVWDALLDPEVLANTLPGCEDLAQTGENQFEGKLAMKVGPVQGVFQGKVTLSDLDPPNGYHLTIDGKGAPGFVKGTGNLTLTEQEGKTLLQYEVDAQVGGRIAGVGQRLLDSSAKVITRQALEGLDAQIRHRTAEASSGSGAAAAAAPSPPSQTKFVTGFVGGLLGELVPEKSRPYVYVAVGGILLVIIALVLRSCGASP